MTKTDTIGLQLYNLCNQKGLDVYKEFGTNFPSQALLQKWFRNEHNLSVEINRFTFDLWVFSISHINDNNKLINYQVEDSYKTYEEALEQGLIKAFSLI